MYNEIVLNRISPVYVKFEPFLFMSLLLLTIINFFAGKMDFTILGSITSIYILVMILAKNYISVKRRLIGLNIIIFIVACFTMTKSGLSATSLVAFLITNISFFIYLPRKYGWTTMILTCCFIVIHFCLVKTGFIDYSQLTFYPRFTFSVFFSIVLGYILLVSIVAFALKLTYSTLHNSLNELTQLAYYDTSSGLPNKSMFKKKYISTLRNRSQTSYFVQIKIKDFRKTKSLLGHEITKNLLKYLHMAFKANLSEEFYIAITGESSLISYMEVNNLTDVISKIDFVFKDFKRSFAEANNIREIEYYLTIVLLEDKQENYEDLFSKVEIASTYISTTTETNYIVFTDSMISDLHKKEKMMLHVKKALDQEKFEVFYQEKIDPTTGMVKGLEALTRWFSDEIGTVPPGVFIPLIEEGNKVIDFGVMVIRNVMMDIEKISRKYDNKILISINISPSHLVSKDFISTIEKLVKNHNVDPKRIILEITEEVFIDNIQVVCNILNTLRNIGFKISLDDFGSGFSSLNYLAQLPLDEIKIDQTFTRQILQSEKVSGLVDAIFKISALYEYNLVVEGVEVLEEVILLQSFGKCDIQGFYYSKPSPLNIV